MFHQTVLRSNGSPLFKAYYIEHRCPGAMHFWGYFNRLPTFKRLFPNVISIFDWIRLHGTKLSVSNPPLLPPPTTSLPLTPAPSLIRPCCCSHYITTTITSLLPSTTLQSSLISLLCRLRWPQWASRKTKQQQYLSIAPSSPLHIFSIPWHHEKLISYRSISRLWRVSSLSLHNTVSVIHEVSQPASATVYIEKTFQKPS